LDGAGAADRLTNVAGAGRPVLASLQIQERLEYPVRRPRILRLSDILEADYILLSAGLRSYICEAARVCLDYHQLANLSTLRVAGAFRRSYRIDWASADEETLRSHADLQEAVEQGAYGLAFLLITDLTEHSVIERSVKTTGFDFWLGDKVDKGLQRKARLEVSGILENPGKISGRTERKKRQTKRSDSVMLPAYVVIVEFSEPQSRVAKR